MLNGPSSNLPPLSLAPGLGHFCVIPVWKMVALPILYFMCTCSLVDGSVHPYKPPENQDF